MTGRVPDNLNIYPWSTDLNWQPDFRGGKFRPKSNTYLEEAHELFDAIKSWEIINSLKISHIKIIVAERDGLAYINWTNVDRKPHTHTSFDNYFDTGVIQPGSTAELPPLRAGRIYPYYCQIHKGNEDTLVDGVNENEVLVVFHK